MIGVSALASACEPAAAPPTTTLPQVVEEPLVVIDGVAQVQDATPSTTTPAVVVSAGDKASPNPVAVTEGMLVEGDQASAVFAGLPPFDAAVVSDTSNVPATTTPPPAQPRPVPLPNTVSDTRLPSTGATSSADATTDKPLTVERYQPEGDVTAAKFITVTFSEPMVPRVTGLNLSSPDVPATIVPAVEGTWRWIGTRTLRFQPAGASLPAATDYTVTVQSGVSAVSGAVLADTVTWHLSTPAPSVVATINASADGEVIADLPGDAVFVIRFDQEVDPSAVINTVLLSVDGELTPIRLAVANEIASDPVASAATKSMPPGHWVAVRAADPLPAAADVTLSVGPGVPSAEGPLTSTTTSTFHAQTFGAFEVDSAVCGDGSACRPGDPFTITLSNPIDGNGFTADEVTIVPSIKDLRIEVADDQIVLAGGTSGRTDYQVSLHPSIVDEFGQNLAEGPPLEFAVADAEPQFIGFSNPFVTVDPARSPGLTVQSINQPALEVTAWVVNPADLDAFYSFASATAQGDVEADPGWPVVFERTINVDAAPNQFATTTIDLADAFNLAGSQIAVRVVPANLADPDSSLFARNRPTVTWAQSTSLGIDAVTDAHQLLIWVTDLSNGKPVSGASVELVGDGRVATTDEEGLAEVPLDASGDTTGIAGLYASTNNRVAFLPGTQGSGWQANTSTVVDDRWFVVGARSVFRPGIPAEFAGWLRQLNTDDGITLSPAEQTTGGYEATDSAGRMIATGDVNLDEAGGFDLSFVVPPDVAQGTATLALSIDGSTAYEYPFEIAPYRPSPITVTVEPNEIDHVGVFAGDTITLAATAITSNGAPAAGAEIGWAIESTLAPVSPPGWDGFVFGLPLDAGPDPSLPTTSRDTADSSTDCADCTSSDDLVATTDLGGHDNINLSVPTSEEAVNLTATATIRDGDESIAAARTVVTVYPADTFVGIRVDEPILSPGETLAVETTTTDLDGKLADSGDTRVTVARVESDSPNGATAENPMAPLVCELSAPTDEGIRNCSVDLAEPGLYHIVATTTDRQGRSSTTEANAYVAGRTPNPTPTPLGQRPKVDLVPDRDSYTPGDTARVLVRAPVSSGFGIAVISNGTIRHVVPFEIEASSAIIEVPIDSTPNVGVDVDVVGKPTDPGAPSAISSGSLELAVPPVDRALNVDVTISPATSESGTADISVTDYNGDPVADADLKLVVVDASLGTPTKLPDLLDTMWAPLEHLLGTQATRDAVAIGASTPTSANWIDSNAVTVEGEPPTTTTDPSAPPMLNTITDIVGAVTTDADGTARAAIRLSPDTRRFQVVAYAAAGADQFGSGQSQVESSKALEVRPLAPRVVTVGDRLELPVQVANGTDEQVNVDVGIQLGRGIRIDDVGPGENGISQTVRRVQVPAQSSVEVHLAVNPRRVGEVPLRVIAAADAAVVSAETTLTVRSKGPDKRDSVVAPLLKGSIAYPLTLPKTAGEVEVSMSASVVLALTDAVVAASSHSPDNRTEVSVEAIAGRLSVLSSTSDRTDRLGSLDRPTAEQSEANSNQLVTLLAEAQLPDGTWPTWTEPSGRTDSPTAIDSPTAPATTDVWATVSAAHALVDARQAGSTVPDDVLERTRAALPTLLTLVPDDAETDLVTILNASILNLRARLGDDVNVAATELASTEALPLEAAAALLPSVDDGDVRSSLIARIEANVVVRDGVASVKRAGDNDRLLETSNARTMADTLNALILAQPDNELIGPLLIGLIDQQQAGRWQTSSIDAAATRAIVLYADNIEQPVGSTVTAPDEPSPFPSSQSLPNVVTSRSWINTAQLGELRARRTMAPTLNAIRIADVARDLDGLAYAAIETSVPIWYRVSVRHQATAADAAPADDGFIIERRFSAATDADSVVGDDAGTWTIDHRAFVRVDVTIVTERPRHDVQINDSLPAGLTAVAPTETPAAWFDDQQLVDGGVVVVVSDLPAGTYEYSYLAQATAPGTFTVPGAAVRELGVDGATGRSATTKVTVS